MRTFGLAAVVATLLAMLTGACVGVAPPTPQIIYVTPPSTVTAAPTASPTPSPSPAPTPAGNQYTSDDERIDALIRESATKTLDFSTRMGDPRPGETVIDVFEAAAQFASTQQIALDVYRPSPCTAPAVALAKEGLRILEEESNRFVSYYRDFEGSEPDVERFTEAGRKVGSAIGALNNSSCEQ